jgi:hypothetical protein
MADMQSPRLRPVHSFAQSIPPFDELAIPEPSVRPALVGSPTLNAAAPIESAAAVTAAALISAFESFLALPAILAGTCAAPVLDFLLD